LILLEVKERGEPVDERKEGFGGTALMGMIDPAGVKEEGNSGSSETTMVEMLGEWKDILWS
jgi:hypothetical protein